MSVVIMGVIRLFTAHLRTKQTVSIFGRT